MSSSEIDLPVARGGPRLTAVLGPTNTGKTHLAVERMLGHATGMIGLPLRLLAREIYDRVAAQMGAEVVALITGEEKIIPAHPRFFVCTVEAMPLERRVAFLAIDEIQLCADAERGHVFTDRLLHARGDEETMFLGADTMRPLIRQLIPDVQFISRPRFSDLTYTGPRKLARLGRRSAVVAFSADAVYGIAELLRSQRGGAAVVMGALSPRTRNAQVALYQSGEVDFLVATDAIGMGLNMDVDHVAFASLTKFDGQAMRALKPTEIAQIAGRAGRHMNDGTFGPTGEVPPFDGPLVEQIEQHRFDPVRVLQWRNPNLDFRSLEGLIRSLEIPPPAKGLSRARAADDLAVLKILAGQSEIAAHAQNERRIGALWDVCQIPDFRKVTLDEHARLLAQIYLHLAENDNRLPTDWIAGQVDRIDVTAGDIDTLSARLAQIRVWTYISHRAGWLDDAIHWQARTRSIEDALSDALHEALTQRFIDRRTSLLMRKLADTDALDFAVDAQGEVTIEGEYVGRLNGFVFEADPRGQVNAFGTSALGPRTLRHAASRALGSEIAQRAQRLSSAPASALQLSEHGKIWWEGAPIARLVAGSNPLSPRVELLADDMLTEAARERVQVRLDLWVREHIAHVLGPLAALASASDLEGLARGLAFQLVEQLGSVARADVSTTVRALDQTARAALRRYGVRFGAHSVFLPALLKPQAAQLKVLLWSLGALAQEPGLRLPAMPAPGLVSVVMEPGAPALYYERAGFRPCGARAVRLDMLERLADLLRPPRPVANTVPLSQAAEPLKPEEALPAAREAVQTGPEGVEPELAESARAAPEPGEAEPVPPAEAGIVQAGTVQAGTVQAGIVQTGTAQAEPDPAAPQGPALNSAASAASPNTESATPEGRMSASVAPVWPRPDAVSSAEGAQSVPRGSVAPDGSFTVTADMMSIVGASGAEFEAILRALGFRARPGEGGALVWRMVRRRDPEAERTRRTPRKEGKREGAAPREGKGIAASRPEGAAGRKGGGAPPMSGKSPKAKGGKPERGFRDGAKPKPQRPAEKPMDPNSPFAKLAILKQAMTKGR